MAVLLESINISEIGVYEIKETVNIRISREQARRLVNRWLLEEVSDMIHAELPTLVVNGQTVWRVPTVLTATHVGTVGAVGTVDVDALTGELLAVEEQREELIQSGLKLAAMLPPYPGPRRAPDEFVPQDLPQAEILILPEEQ